MTERRRWWPSQPRVLRVDDTGVRLLALDDRPLDVCFDGRRVWTFWTRRDTRPVAGPAAGPLRRVGWPRPLVRHLDGRARLTVRASDTGARVFDAEVQFGDAADRVTVVNDDGVELGFDKSGKLVPTFANRTGGDIEALVDATEAVIGALRDVGLEPFLAYGTLLGAVREGRVLGHDSDADLGYVSRHTVPVDVIRESFSVQRRLNEQGWPTSRYSGGAFKVTVTRGGLTVGLDVFGGFLDHGRLYLLGEVATPFREEWIRPLGTAELNGRPLPVPAMPEKLLEAMYGPGWRTPDPAFRFTTPRRSVRALSAWFRGTQPGLRFWERRANTVGPRAGDRERSELAARTVSIAEQMGPRVQVVDVGAGLGADALWVARQGVPVVAYDYVPKALERPQRRADREGADLEVRYLNLCELRSVLAEGARLAHDPRPRVVMARHVLDATNDRGREAFARLCSMLLREGGAVLVDFHPGGDLPEEGHEEWDELHDVPDRPGRDVWMVDDVDEESLTILLQQAGASRIEVERWLNVFGRPTVRLVGWWSHAAELAATGS